MKLQLTTSDMAKSINLWKPLSPVTSLNLLSFPLYLPKILRLLKNWPLYLMNYLGRRSCPAEYRMRNGYRLIDGAGTLAGTIAVVFVREEYGPLKTHKTIVDIGANMGSFALFAAQRCPGARIFCYEPDSRNFAVLKQNIDVNGLQERVLAFPCAVASESGDRKMGLAASPDHSLLASGGAGAEEWVRCTTLRDILQQHDLETVDFLKVNCEGAEYEILYNCTPEELQHVANIHLEYHSCHGQRNNGNALCEYLRGKGFEIGRFTRHVDRTGLFKESGFIWAAR
jgi:FkbM family methyltransferase